MRRGPAGPRTLCNACGLMWANKVDLVVLIRLFCSPSHATMVAFWFNNHHY